MCIHFIWVEHKVGVSITPLYMWDTPTPPSARFYYFSPYKTLNNFPSESDADERIEKNTRNSYFSCLSMHLFTVRTSPRRPPTLSPYCVACTDEISFRPTLVDSLAGEFMTLCVEARRFVWIDNGGPVNQEREWEKKKEWNFSWRSRRHIRLFVFFFHS